MRTITSNLLKFALFFLAGSILFRYGLSWSITNHAGPELWIFAILYFIFNFSIGWFFGKRDYESFPLNDVGFRFHLVTYVIFNVIWEAWYLLGLSSPLEKPDSTHQIALFWGIFLLLHFIIYLFARKNSIKGLDKTEIFE